MNGWTIEELGERVAKAIDAVEVPQSSGRVRAVPDTRTIRYYGTLGLIDRPSSMRGRTALYGRKHFLQIVAIKRLQARGANLVEVQEKLAGASESELLEMAGTDIFDAPVEEVAKPEARSRRDSFWHEAPAAPPPALPEERADVLTGIKLARNLTVLFPSCRPLDAEDIQALGEAARPLLEALIQRGLLHDPKEGSVP